MKLPKLPYSKAKAKKQIIDFRGLNVSENTQEGELHDSIGLSTARYPCISQRDGRENLTEYSDPTDIFEWNGALVVVDGNALYCAGEKVADVAPGKKQFAVVNTKLCVFPDKIIVDLINHDCAAMDHSVSTAKNAQDIKVTHNSISTNYLSAVEMGIQLCDAAISPLVAAVLYLYGTGKEHVEECWSELDKTWNMDSLSSLETKTSVHGTIESMIIIPQKVSESAQENRFRISFDESWVQEKEYTDEGYYAVLTPVENSNGSVSLFGTLYQAGKGTLRFDEAFVKGDPITITGTQCGLCDVDKALLVDVNKNMLTFSDNTFRTDVVKCVDRTAALPPGKYAVRNDTYFSAYNATDREWLLFNTTISVSDGCIFVATASSPTEIEVLDSETKTVVEICKVTASVLQSGSSWEDSLDGYTRVGVLSDFVHYDPESYYKEKTTPVLQVTFSKSFPELDFICESGNRLWGVSNKDNSVYASVFGDPTNFYLYDVSNDESGYVLTFGSEGEFTGICSYGNGVCCWKERRLHKVLGDIPSEYYSNEYEIPGVQKGSERSLAVINETLFYKGVFGVYAYTGGVPSLISYNLGNEKMTAGVAGYDGRRYYLNLLDEQGLARMLTYDPAYGLWLKEDTIRAEAFVTMDATMYFLSDGVIYKAGQHNKEKIAWMAEFVPFTEMQYAKKGYSALRLRLDMSEGSYIKVETKIDRGSWRLICIRSATSDMTINIPLRMERCDQFAVRLSGEGDVVLRSMTREFSVWSEI